MQKQEILNYLKSNQDYYYKQFGIKFIFKKILVMFKSNRDYKLYIEDIANESKSIKIFAKNITYDEFEKVIKDMLTKLNKKTDIE